MRQVARLGDPSVGVCAIHGPRAGNIVTASPNVFANNIPVARLGDTVLASCGHTGILVTGSPNDYANNLLVARIGDSTAGIYVATIVGASPDVFAES